MGKKPRASVAPSPPTKAKTVALENGPAELRLAPSWSGPSPGLILISEPGSPQVALIAIAFGRPELFEGLPVFGCRTILGPYQGIAAFRAVIGCLFAAALASSAQGQGRPVERPAAGPATGHTAGGADISPRKLPAPAVAEPPAAPPQARALPAANPAETSGEGLTVADWISALSAAVSAISAVAVAGFTWRLIVLGKEQHQVALGALQEAAKAAGAADLSARAAIGVEIPTLRVLDIVSYGRTPIIDPFDLREDLLAEMRTPRLKIRVMNYGRTPAFLKGEAICVATNTALGDIPDYSEGAIELPPSAVIGPGETYALSSAPQHSVYSEEDVKSFLDQSQTLYVYGYVWYEDFLRNQHMLRFVFERVVKGPGRYRYLEAERPGYSSSF